jgi:hypothetical protein
MVEELVERYGEGLVRKLSEKYCFNAEEAMEYVSLRSKRVEEKKKKSVHQKPKVVLPWAGMLINGWCKGLRPNHGLISQCTQEPTNDGYCKTCLKQVQTKGQPKCGTVEARIATEAKGEIYKNPETGKAPVKYGTVLAKLNIDKATALSEAKKFGIEIPESEFVVETKKQGRPRKEPAKVKESSGDDMLASLVQQAVATSGSGTTSSSDSESETEGGPKFSESEQNERTSLIETLSSFTPKPEFDTETITVNDLKTLLKKTEEYQAERAKLEPTVAKILETDAEFANAPTDLMVSDIQTIKDWIKDYKARVKDKKEAEKVAKEAEKVAKKAAKEAVERTKLIAKMEKFKNPPDFDSETILISELKELIKTTKATEDAAKEQVKKERQAKKEGKHIPKIETAPAPAPAPEPEPELEHDPIYDAETEDEEEEIKVVKMTIDGKEYLLDENTNIVYDPESEEAIGAWNPITKQIEKVEEPGDEDSEDEG